MDPKPIQISWTVWFNVLTFLAAVLALPEFVALVHPDVLPYIIAVQAVINLLLRIKTTQPITLPKFR